eukprot:6262701-Amphidinium_carterae.1
MFGFWGSVPGGGFCKDGTLRHQVRGVLLAFMVRIGFKSSVAVVLNSCQLLEVPLKNMEVGGKLISGFASTLLDSGSLCDRGIHRILTEVRNHPVEQPGHI